MMQKLHDIATTTASKGAAYAGAAGNLFFGAVTANELAALVGIALGIATFVVNVYFQRRRLRLEELRMMRETDGR